MRFRRLSLAVRTDPEEFNQMRHLLVASLAQFPFRILREKCIDAFHLPAGLADDVVVVRVVEINLVESGAVVEEAAPH